jgi:predicted RNA binding protein YcfA (HicA-like mRNA interferase family)
VSKLKLINATKLEKILFRLGFEKIRQKGSHVLYRHADGRVTTIPFHIGKDLPRPLLRSILNNVKLSIDDYNEMV